jgi:hypothetical protein
VALGGEAFAGKVRARLAEGRESSGGRGLRARRSWGQVVRAVEELRGRKWEQFAGRHGDPGRALALYVAWRCTGLRLSALGQAAGGMDSTAVSRAVKRFEQRLGEDKALRRMTERLLADN